MKNPPKIGDKSLEGLPSSPMEKHTTFALVQALETKFSTARLSSTILAVVIILHMFDPFSISCFIYKLVITI